MNDNTTIEYLPAKIPYVIVKIVADGANPHIKIAIQHITPPDIATRLHPYKLHIGPKNNAVAQKKSITIFFSTLMQY